MIFVVNSTAALLFTDVSCGPTIPHCCVPCFLLLDADPPRSPAYVAVLLIIDDVWMAHCLGRSIDED
jgi:hypothetical protein